LIPIFGQQTKGKTLFKLTTTHITSYYSKVQTQHNIVIELVNVRVQKKHKVGGRD